jgi:hypothetical protein
MKIITTQALQLPAADIRMILQGSKRTLWFPVDPQPQVYKTNGEHTAWCWPDENKVLWWDRPTFLLDYCPVRPGRAYWVQEPWKPTRSNLAITGEPRKSYIRFQDDSRIEVPHDMTGSYGDPFLPAETMPEAFSRLRLQVTAVGAVQTASLTETDFAQDGWQDTQWTVAQEWFANEWDSRYPETLWKTNPWTWVVTFEPEVLHVQA